MRHGRAALAGLAVAAALTVAVLGVELARARRIATAQMEECERALNGGGGVCSGYAQAGGAELPVTFALGFVAGYAWALRVRRS